MNKRKNSKIEYGDFQTPMYLAQQIVQLLVELGVAPQSIVEPTCGKGNLLLAALDVFTVKSAIGIDVNAHYIQYLESQLAQKSYIGNTIIRVDDFFFVDWANVLDSLPSPLLMLGNPPWVTNTTLSTLGSDNLPIKTNFKGLSGLSAKTGKSNFDISEWILLHLLTLSFERPFTLAMLCKTSVARKILLYAWKHNISISSAAMYRIDAQKAFGATVDACLLICDTAGNVSSQCHVYEDLSSQSYRTAFGYVNGALVANIAYYQKWQHLQGRSSFRWRSGVKHDAVKVMELRQVNGRSVNKLGESFDLESECLYPMLKSSEIANQHLPHPSRWMLVTQQHTGEDTSLIQHYAPKTWAYLQYYADNLDRRKSSIYKNRPRFSIFGVGDYTFSQWKVAISGLYKKLRFVAIGPYEGKPVVFDDTCYFIACQTQRLALFLAELLNSIVAQQFFEAFIFWDAKRPITVDVLKRLDLLALAEELGKKDTMLALMGKSDEFKTYAQQLSLWRR